MSTNLLAGYVKSLQLPLPAMQGLVTRVCGLTLEGVVQGASVGQLFRIDSPKGSILAEVIGLHGKGVVLMPYGDVSGLQAGATLKPEGGAPGIGVGESLLGRVIDSFGNPLDGGARPETTEERPLHASPPSPLQRDPIDHRLGLGVRCIDAFVPCGRGQRLGIFAGSGVGKSVLLGMIAKATQADVVVLALVGERGREVGHFVSKVLGKEGLRKSVLVVATSDRPAPERIRSAHAATSVAEYFRDQGKSVLLFVDSLTRLCMAQREVGLAAGEPPTTKGYPPSSFACLAPLVERAAPTRGGSITGIYSVLVEGDDLADPVADTVRSLLDGHIVLSRALADKGHYPPVDVLKSLSRLASDLYTPQETQAVRQMRHHLARCEEARELLTIGAYKPGRDRDLDAALAIRGKLDAFLQQGIDERTDIDGMRRTLFALAAEEKKS